MVVLLVAVATRNMKQKSTGYSNVWPYNGSSRVMGNYHAWFLWELRSAMGVSLPDTNLAPTRVRHEVA
ncbi:MAG: hypothetical protein K0R12_1416 [Gammaproteobacteria bacterium]|nr:hypothetical protein [Gammaproteobacteria bacterium]